MPITFQNLFRYDTGFNEIENEPLTAEIRQTQLEILQEKQKPLRRSFLNTWLLLLHENYPAFPQLVATVYEHSRTFTQNELENLTTASRLNNLERSTNNLEDTFLIHITNCQRGLEYFDKVKQHASELNLRHIPQFTSHLITSRSHRIDVYEYTNKKGLRIITNRPNETPYNKLLGAYWAFSHYEGVTTHFQQQPPNQNIFLRICKAIYEDNAEEYLSIIKEYLEEITAYKSTPEYKYSLLKNALGQHQEKTKKELFQKIEQAEETIEITETRLISALRTKKELQQRLMGLTTSQVEENTAFQELMNFIQKSGNTYEFIGPNPDEEGHILMNITTTISSYRPNEAKAYIKTESSLFSQSAPLKTLIEKVFIEETYKLITKTGISFSLFPHTKTRRGSHVPHNPFIENPHIRQYNCFENARNQIHRAMSNGDFITALAQTTAACGNINFSDGMTIQHFYEYLKQALVQEKKVIFDPKTKETLTIQELHDRCTQTTKEEASNEEN